MKTIKKYQSGFSIIEIFVVLFVLGLVGFIGYTFMSQNNKQISASKPAAQTKKTDISLQNLGLESIDSVLVDSNALREYDSKGLKGFYVFGDKLGGKSDTRINPNFEFASLKVGTKVVSAIDGIVAFTKEQPESGDTEVFIQPKEGSIWTIGYDHIANVAVKKGDEIKAGDVIGEPAAQGNGALRFEIQINKDENGTTTHVCPSSLLDERVKGEVLHELFHMMESWESTTGLELYDTTLQNPIGCLKKTMSIDEAEGR